MSLGEPMGQTPLRQREPCGSPTLELVKMTQREKFGTAPFECRRRFLIWGVSKRSAWEQTRRWQLRKWVRTGLRRLHGFHVDIALHKSVRVTYLQIIERRQVVRTSGSRKAPRNSERRTPPPSAVSKDGWLSSSQPSIVLNDARRTSSLGGRRFIFPWHFSILTFCRSRRHALRSPLPSTLTFIDRLRAGHHFRRRNRLRLRLRFCRCSE